MILLMKFKIALILFSKSLKVLMLNVSNALTILKMYHNLLLMKFKIALILFSKSLKVLMLNVSNALTILKMYHNLLLMKLKTVLMLSKMLKMASHKRSKTEKMAMSIRYQLLILIKKVRIALSVQYVKKLRLLRVIWKQQQQKSTVSTLKLHQCVQIRTTGQPTVVATSRHLGQFSLPLLMPIRHWGNVLTQ